MEMAVDTITPAQFHEHARRWEQNTWTTELLLACGAVVLSILGIVGVLQPDLAAIDLTSRVDAAEVSRGITAEFLAGVAGIVLGILALLRIAPMTLMSVAVITYGGTLLLTSGESVWLNAFGKENELVYQLRRSMGLAAAGAQVLVGLAGLVLGILGVIGILPIMMILVALLAIGSSILLRSSFVGGLLLDFLRM
jgi:hypothetical protein